MKVKIQTTLGDIVVRLYDETPIHRENFMKLVKEGYYATSMIGTPNTCWMIAIDLQLKL